MAEYIERNKLLHKIRWASDPEDCVMIAKRMPASDVVPVRHGRWIKGGYVCGDNEYECSACHETEWRTSVSRVKYCMFCGAKMDGGESDA